MRKFIYVVLLVLLTQTPPVFKASAFEQETEVSPPPPSQVGQKNDGFADSEDDIFSSTYERELLSRRFFQKNLPPLTAKEKIVWSFKTSRANVLL